MIKVEDNIIVLIEKIRSAIRNGTILLDSLPLEELGNLMESTMGDSFWRCIGSEPNMGFRNMPEIYMECLRQAVDRKDAEECERILALYECSYLAFYTALGEDEKVFRQSPYRQMIISLGTMNARMQQYLHAQRQKDWKEKNGFLTGGKGVVYTYLPEGKELHQPKAVCPWLKYICFTDDAGKQGTKEGAWHYHIMERGEQKGKDFWESRCKIMAHELLADYDYSIWVDSDIIISGDILQFCELYGGGKSFLCFMNEAEDCIYENVSELNMKTDDLNIAVRKKLFRYEKEGYPKNYGLIENRVMVRDHRDPEMCKVMELWWEEIADCYSFMGNMFNYIAWKHRFPFSVCGLSLYSNPYFQYANLDLDISENL